MPSSGLWAARGRAGIKEQEGTFWGSRDILSQQEFELSFVRTHQMGNLRFRNVTIEGLDPQGGVGGKLSACLKQNS